MDCKDKSENGESDAIFEIVIDEKFGFLIIVDGYISDHKLALFKELLSFQEPVNYQYKDDEYEKFKRDSKPANNIFIFKDQPTSELQVIDFFFKIINPCTSVLYASLAFQNEKYRNKK